MILAIIFISLAIILGYRAGSESYPFDFGNFLTSFILCLFLGAIVIIVGHGFTSKHHTHYEYKDLHIESLTNETESEWSGTFILGCGSIRGGETEYYYTYGNFPKGLKMVEFKATQTYIRETNAVSPRIKEYHERPVFKEFESKWFFGGKANVGDWRENYKADVIIVPENTIYKEFKID